jgi:hypothetical protein
VPTAFVLGVQQQSGELVDGAAEAGHMAGNGRGDPVTVLGRALTVRTHGSWAYPLMPRNGVECRWRSGWWVLSGTVGSSRKDVDATQAR